MAFSSAAQAERTKVRDARSEAGEGMRAQETSTSNGLTAYLSTQSNLDAKGLVAGAS